MCTSDQRLASSTVVLAGASSDARTLADVARALSGRGISAEVLQGVDLDLGPLRAAVARLPASVWWVICRDEELDGFQADRLRETLRDAGRPEARVRVFDFDADDPSTLVDVTRRWLRATGALQIGSALRSVAAATKARPTCSLAQREAVPLSRRARTKTGVRIPPAPPVPARANERSTVQLPAAVEVPAKTSTRSSERPTVQLPAAVAEPAPRRSRATMALSAITPRPAKTTPPSRPARPTPPSTSVRPRATGPAAPIVVPAQAPVTPVRSGPGLRPRQSLVYGLHLPVVSAPSPRPVATEAPVAATPAAPIAAAPVAAAPAPAPVVAPTPAVAAAPVVAPSAVAAEGAPFAHGAVVRHPFPSSDQAAERMRQTTGSWVTPPARSVAELPARPDRIRTRRWTRVVASVGVSIAAAFALMFSLGEGADDDIAAVTVVASAHASDLGASRRGTETPVASDSAVDPSSSAPSPSTPASVASVASADRQAVASAPVPTTAIEQALLDRRVRALDELFVTTAGDEVVERHAASRTCADLARAGVDDWQLPSPNHVRRLVVAGFIAPGERVWVQAGPHKPPKRAVVGSRGTTQLKRVAARAQAQSLCVKLVHDA
jgi:hypothetical protein